MFGRLFEYEIHGEHKADECREVVPVQVLPLEEDVGDDAEDNQRDDFLYDFELHQVERSAVVDEADTVGRHLTAVLEKGNHPREGNDQIEGPVRGDARLLQAQMSVPRERHKHIAHDEQQNRINTVCHIVLRFWLQN